MPFEPSLSPADSLEAVAAPTSDEVTRPTLPAQEDFIAIDRAGTSPRNKWLALTAVLGLVGGAGLGLGATRAWSAWAAAPSPARTDPPAVMATPASEPRVMAAAAASAQAASGPPASTTETAIPWDDLPQNTAKSCETLATVAAGPKALLAGQAVASAQRAVVRGDTAAAYAAFCTAAQLGVANDTVLLGLARALLAQFDPAAALEAVDQSIEQAAPTNKQAFELRGDILIRLGKVDEARQAWFKAAGATRASKLLVDNLIRASDADAKTALRSGDLSRADRMLRRSIALTSGDPEHCRMLITVLDKNGNEVAAERWRAYLSARGS